MSNNIEALEKTLPIAPLKLVAMESCKDLGHKVNDYLFERTLSTRLQPLHFTQTTNQTVIL